MFIVGDSVEGCRCLNLLAQKVQADLRVHSFVIAPSETQKRTLYDRDQSNSRMLLTGCI